MAKVPGAKGYRAGTHRAVGPAETLARFLPLADAMGITRLANVTGLDRLGVPVVMAVRPGSRSLSVSQGKGMDLAAAKASAFMEAAETFHAEQAKPTLEETRLDDLPRSAEAPDWRRLPRVGPKRFGPGHAISWSKGKILADGRPIWIPYDLVHTDYRTQRPASGFFPLSSNGLASGNSLAEATCAALSELIERDATTLWRRRSAETKALRRIDLETVDHPSCRALLATLTEREIAVKVWDLTTDVGVAAFLCRIEDRAKEAGALAPVFHGSGAHLARDIAFLRAVTEAVQTRLTYIAGSRDDLRRPDYRERPEAAILETVLSAWETRFPPRAFSDVPDLATETFEADLELLLSRLAGVGVAEAVVVDLSKEAFGIPVVRVVAPGLEFIDSDPRFVPGERARRVAAEAR